MDLVHAEKTADIESGHGALPMPSSKRSRGMERVSALTSPPVVGRRYLVPTVHYPWLGHTKAWPVFPNMHEDAEHFNFPDQHYHVDPRFLTKSDWERATEYYGAHGYGDPAFETCQVFPLASRGYEHPAIEWRVKVCQRQPEYVVGAAEPMQRLRAAYAGQQCAKSRTGWVCPHRNFALGSIRAVDGVVTCPLHGLRIDAESGLVLAPDGASSRHTQTADDASGMNNNTPSRAASGEASRPQSDADGGE